MKALKLIATVMSLGISSLGLVGIAAPAILLGFGSALIAPPALYWVAAVRGAFGALLILVATQSRLPRTLRTIGTIILVAGLITPLVGTELVGEVFAWFSSQPTLLVRAIAFVPFVVGLFFVYVINRRRDFAPALERTREKRPWLRNDLRCARAAQRER